MDISVFGLGTVAAITVLCYLAGTGVKTTPLDNKYIPVICGGTGLVLGLVALYAGMPEFPAADPITAAAVGAVSGLAATGINQAVKMCIRDRSWGPPLSARSPPPAKTGRCG